MPDFLEKKWALGILLVASIIVHFLFFGHPPQTVFDEVHFGKFISGYYTHEYYFDIHPPLGKLIIAGFATFFDFKPGFSFGEIGDVFPDNTYKALRFLPTLAGTLLPLILYLLAREIGFSAIASFAAGVLITFENALLTQSRFILLDAFLLLFGFTALFFYFKYRNTFHWKYLIGTGMCGALALSIKWTGATFLALPVLIELYYFVRTRSLTHWRQKIFTFVFIPLVLYMAVFAIHFLLLYKSGEGDAFMSERFQSTLQGGAVEPVENPPTFIEKFLELNEEMYLSNQRLTAEHPYGSKWFTWPLMYRPIFYWVQDSARIYLFGNPLLWWLSSIAVLYLFFCTIVEREKISPAGYILLAGFALNLIPFVGIERIMFLYHYLAALIFAILALVYVIDLEHSRVRYFKTLMVLAIASFVFFSPLNYGVDIEQDLYLKRIWLKSWE